jgi:hypothetical protein
MDLKIENVPDGLVKAVRIEAMAAGVTLRSMVIGFLERAAAGEEQAVEAPAEAKNPGATASPRARSFVSAKPRGTKQARKQAVGGSRPPMEREGGAAPPREEIKPCSHGLLFHPNCTDGS